MPSPNNSPRASTNGKKSIERNEPPWAGDLMIAPGNNCVVLSRRNPAPVSFTCHALCLLKILVFGLIIYFILSIPLGTLNDNDVKTPKDSRFYAKEAICIFCDVCDAVAKMARRSYDLAEQATNFVLENMYIGKLKFYSFLSKVDHRDLCKQSQCCEPDPERLLPRPENCYCRKKLSKRSL